VNCQSRHMQPSPLRHIRAKISSAALRWAQTRSHLLGFAHPLLHSFNECAKARFEIMNVGQTPDAPTKEQLYPTDTATEHHAAG